MNNENPTLLYTACIQSNFELVQILIDEKADVNEQYGKNGETCLYYACNDQNIEMVKLLIDNKAKVNIKSDNNMFTPLHLLCVMCDCDHSKCDKTTPNKMCKNRDIIKILIENNADVNCTKYYSPLWFCSSQCPKIVKLLLKNKANVNNDEILEDSCLHQSCKFNNLKITKLLLKYGANKSKLNHDYDYPLDLVDDIHKYDYEKLFYKLDQK